MRGAASHTCASTHSTTAATAPSHRVRRRETVPATTITVAMTRSAVAEQVVDGKPERRHHQHERGELQPGPRFRVRPGSTAGGACEGQCARLSWGEPYRSGLSHYGPYAPLSEESLLMPPVLALYEDVFSNEATLALPPLPRMIFVVHGGVTIADRTLGDGEAWHGEGAATLAAGATGATCWRFELTSRGARRRPPRPA